MKRATRIALGSAALAACLGFAAASRANAQIRFEGSFPLPHGRISVGVGHPTFPNGSFVPEGYSVYDDPEYGYGFSYGNEWVSCRPYGRRWVIVERRPYFGIRGYGYAAPYHPGHRHGYSGRYGRDFDSRRFERDDRFRSFRREDRRFRDDRNRWGDRDRFRDNRRGGRQNDRFRDRDRRWNR